MPDRTTSFVCHDPDAIAQLKATWRASPVMIFRRQVLEEVAAGGDECRLLRQLSVAGDASVGGTSIATVVSYGGVEIAIALRSAPRGEVDARALHECRRPIGVRRNGPVATYAFSSA